MVSLPSRLFLIWSRSRGSYTSLKSLLESDGWTVLIVADLTSLSRLQTTNGGESLMCLAVLCPTTNPTQQELDAVNEFIKNGNHALYASAASDDDGFLSPSTIINQLSLPYGVEFNQDCVIRPNLYEMYHPQEAMIENFVANRGLEEVLKRHVNQRVDSLSKSSNGPVKFGPRALYATGCTLKVDIKRSTITMTSSKWALPSGQAICAFHRAANKSRIIMLGSAFVMSDKYLDKEDNRSLVETLLEYFGDENFPINISDARTIEIAENNLTPDIKKLAEKPIGCLREFDALPENKSDLIERKLFTADTCQLPKIIKAYKDLSVSYEPLTLMKPALRWKSREDVQAKFGLKRSDKGS